MGRGRFGPYGGQYVPETLMSCLLELEEAYTCAKRDAAFQESFGELLKNYSGRPTPLYLAKRFGGQFGEGVKLYLKREDLNHTGAHKINNCLGQALLAKRMGKRRLIAETGAGQHGVATATVAALFEMKCTVYMGELDMIRQRPNLVRMTLLGADVVPVASGSRTLKDATSEAIRDWVANVDNTYYIIGSTVGPHPYPTIVRDMQAVIGVETRAQILEREGRLPTCLIACVGGGSNALGFFYAFLRDKEVQMFGVEAGGSPSGHAAALARGTPGVLHGSYSYLLQDKSGQVELPHSIAPGLDYPGVGPEHGFLKDSGRVTYTEVTDGEAVEAFRDLAELEGILPALEPSHALAFAKRYLKNEAEGGGLVIVNLSGRGDKDVDSIEKYMKERPGIPGHISGISCLGKKRSPRLDRVRISAGETSGRLPRGQTGRIVVGKKALGTTTRALKEEGKKALVAYLMAGFPDEETFIELLRAAASAGCDVIEVGIPFSDPIADGPLIQSASKQALDSGVTLKGVLDLVGPIALELGAPLVIMSYLNPVLRLGIEPFARKASASGFVGVILPDVPVEESGNIRGFLGRAGISYVDLLAPTSSRERIERVAGAADGFLYLVSVTGVTGVRPELSRDLGDFIARVRSVTSLPLYVGFGISSAEQAGEVAKLCDGVIVGSAIVAEARSSPSKSAVVENVQAFLEKVRAAVDDSSSVSRG